MKKFVVGIIYFLLKLNLFALSGLSASKFSAYNIDTIKKGHFEFEPSYYYGKYNTFTTTGIVLRTTLGIFDNFEFGISYGNESNVFDRNENRNHNFSFGMKYAAFKKGFFNFGFLFGVSNSNHISGDDFSIEGGVLATLNSGKKFSIDINVLYELETDRDGITSPFNLHSVFDAGYYVTDYLQLCFEAYHSLHKQKNNFENFFQMSTGTTFEYVKNLVLVLGVSFDLYSKEEKGITFFTASTIFF